jgi:hypothetical protein
VALRPLIVLVVLSLSAAVLAGCAGLGGAGLPTLLPTEFMPTAIALTLQAQGVGVSTPVERATSMEPSGPTGTAGPAATQPQELQAPPPTRTPGRKPASATPTASTSPTAPPTPMPLLPLATATATLAAPFPDAPVQIYRVGELSKVNSPLPVSLNLTSHVGKVVRVELHGEDGRLLARYLRTYDTIPWEVAKIGIDLDFGISAAAEAGRLVVSVEDSFGRLVDVNSLNLILISIGQSELNPPTALWQRLIIEEPAPNALIQGGKLIISGRALPNDPEQPLRVMLVGEDGRVLGQRLAGVQYEKAGDYGAYVAEVPYTVDGLTPALLVIYEEGGLVSDIAHLSSAPVILAP